MSLAGGVLSTLLMALCLRLFARHVSYIGIGVAGAVAHNMGQLGMAMRCSTILCCTIPPGCCFWRWRRGRSRGLRSTW